LAAIADRITVILPWGSLLAAVAGSNLDSLHQIARLCLPDATVEIVLSYDEQRDTRKGNPLGAGGLDAEHVAGTLPRLYEQGGLPLVAIDRISHEELASFQTTWAKRLAVGRQRTVWRLRAKRLPSIAET
jgi:hypothetical protein